MLTLNFAQLLERLRAADKALLVVALLTALALLYAGNQGLAWYGSYSRAADLRLEAQQLRTAIGNTPDGESTAASRLDLYEAVLAAESEALEFETNDEIIGLLGDLSRENRVRLANTSVNPAGTRPIGPVQYEVVNVSARVEGQLSRIYQYIDSISSATPSLTIVSVSLGGFGQNPWAQLDVEFLVRPAAAAGSAS